jgi:small-conductance mechanosensitive channel
MYSSWTQGLAVFRNIMEYPLFKLGDSSLNLETIIQLVVLLGVIVVAERRLRELLRRRVLARTHLSEDLQYTLSRLAGYCFLAGGFFFALKLIHLDLSAFAVIFGALSIGVGFGLQNIVSNFISGLIILAERPIAVGHRVEVGSVMGQVTQINLRSTTVVTNDNITFIVPNSNFITSVVTNWSYGDPKVRIRIPIGVAYGSDVDKLKALLLEVAAGNASVLKDPAPSVFFVGFGDSSLNFELGVWTIDQASRPLPFRSELNFAIEHTLREHKIEIPFPQRDIYLRSGTIKVETKAAPAS